MAVGRDLLAVVQEQMGVLTALRVGFAAAFGQRRSSDAGVRRQPGRRRGPNAAVAGALAGARFGAGAIPSAGSNRCAPASGSQASKASRAGLVRAAPSRGFPWAVDPRGWRRLRLRHPVDRDQWPSGLVTCRSRRRRPGRRGAAPGLIPRARSMRGAIDGPPPAARPGSFPTTSPRPGRDAMPRATASWLGDAREVSAGARRTTLALFGSGGRSKLAAIDPFADRARHP